MVPWGPMRRTALLTAMVYGFSFVAVCLAACFMPAVAEHGCCAPEEGISAAPRDCCAVTPAVIHGAAAVGTIGVASYPVAPLAVDTPLPAPRASQPSLSPSPPLVLRV